jgi:Fungal protein kinase
VIDLLVAIQNLPVARTLPSSAGRGTLRSDLLRLGSLVDTDGFEIERIFPLLQAVLKNEPDGVIWNKVSIAVIDSTPLPCALPNLDQTPFSFNTSSFVNTSEYRKHVDDVLKVELGSDLYIGVPRFYEAFFGEIEGLETAAAAIFMKCQKGVDPLYSEELGWHEWPQGAKEKDVLKWFAKLIEFLLDAAKEVALVPNTRRRPLAQPDQPLQGSTAGRKLDVGFVNDPKANQDSRCHWSKILVPGELKSNPDVDRHSKTWLDLGRYAREVLAAQDTRRFVLGFTLCGSTMRLWEFDRLGGIASSPFDINKDGLQFVCATLGYLWMSEEQLGFDPTIVETEGKRYIDIVRNDQKERLILQERIKRAPCVAGRATTCWKAYREGDESQTPLVVKDSWQYPEREEEGELLREATEKEVVNVARYYHHETVRVGGQDDDIYKNVRKGLDITRATNYKARGSIVSPNTSKVYGSPRKGRSTSTAGQKRSSSYTDISLPPPSKRTCSSSPTKGRGNPADWDRVHRRVILSDYGKPLYRASSRVAMLTALEDCIEGYESLYTRTGMLQSDISIGNLMMNEDDDNHSWRAFLIDLDLAIKEQREESSGARGKTGTRAFMAIGVLLGEKHSFMHDLESFFWVLFWICIHYSGLNGKARVVPQFEEWSYVGMEKLAKLKLGTISEEEIFLNTVKENFTSYYGPLISWIKRLRRVLFPGGGRRKEEDRELFSLMKTVLEKARDDPQVSMEL